MHPAILDFLHLVHNGLGVLINALAADQEDTITQPSASAPQTPSTASTAGSNSFRPSPARRARGPGVTYLADGRRQCSYCIRAALPDIEEDEVPVCAFHLNRQGILRRQQV